MRIHSFVSQMQFPKILEEFVVANAVRICVLALFLAPQYLLAQDDQSVMRDATVRVFCKTANNGAAGSGFLVGIDGEYVLTNAHVIRSCSAAPMVFVSTKDGDARKPLRSKVIWDSNNDPLNRHLDVALLALEVKANRKGVRFANSATAQEDRKSVV